MNVFENKPWLGSYAPGVPSTIQEPTDTLCDMIETSARRFGSSVALDFFGATTTYAELGEQISRAANGLLRLGVKPGDRVALVLPNCPQHVVAFYAVLRLGAIVVEHNPLYTERELRHQFEDHGARVAIVWDKIYQTVTDFPADLGLRTVIAVNLTEAMPLAKRLLLKLPVAKARESRDALTSGPLGKDAFTWSGIVGSRKLRPGHPRPKVTDTAALQYTSGTTGTPKGAILSHFNLRSNALQGEAWVQGLRPGEEVFYAVLPMFHAYGLTLCLTFAMATGARLVLFPKFDEGLLLDAARRTPPTFMPAVPPIYDRLVKAAAAKNVSLRSIRYAISGAMSLPVSIVERWEAATGGLLVEGYGMTEASPIAVGNPMGPSRRPGTVGVPFPSTEIRVVDPDDPTVNRGIEEEGELLIRGPQVFSGYWDQPTETAKTLLDGGWLRTGDIVRVSSDGFVTVVDRIKELIITGGFNVAPSEVEAALLSHPDVADAAVVGLPSANGGEDVAAAVVLAAGATLDVDAIRTYCRTRLSAYKVPRTIVEVDELPRSLIGKVLRREVRAGLIKE
ncbi:long-chain fatty acid--CoA ligase [Cryobacterium sp. TMT2-18-3]|uniref:long-chain-fatty-acid--CoA ligase n=1 Tax=unclassified Cryobacterium TaxID=2649013 RepID=UPI0010690B1F|nr:MULTISPECIES: long-chain-fatty-acid--CoA ligase [unclassified Cryobacterium]TFC30502.1 long-chain fatty acid--CoA ligase [Cryobacterium sp. TMT2-18-2]TFC37174.1 long-chain fatty acid--CoA ligase [Cryobacterium sp. TMT2-42-4]TFC68280.1 long-chain fatty acid--CoA ligase [Cryobacterium sp. TMT2-18-3]